MSPNDLLPSVQTLPRADKLRLMQWLETELAPEEGAAPLLPDAEHTAWSPYDAHEAAATLHHFLERERVARR
jgi:hypothetical protein